jgi:hypothetical protein
VEWTDVDMLCNGSEDEDTECEVVTVTVIGKGK